MNHLFNNLRDFKRIFWPGTYRPELFNDSYALKADEHAQKAAASDELALVADWLRPDPPREILDVGCATGRPLDILCRLLDTRGSGTDVNPHALEKARAAFPERDFLLMKDGILPFADASFDHACCHHVIGHVPSPSDLLAEILRVLRPGGTLSVITPNARYKLWQTPFNILRDFAPDTSILRYFTPGSLAELLTLSGFKMDRLIPFGPLPSFCPPLEPFRLRAVALAHKP
ncbi:MAG: class I SAM-dependent methyltransferase [Planctomycetota bacterium]